jgi:hypothetical protein
MITLSELPHVPCRDPFLECAVTSKSEGVLTMFIRIVFAVLSLALLAGCNSGTRNQSGNSDMRGRYGGTQNQSVNPNAAATSNATPKP